VIQDEAVWIVRLIPGLKSPTDGVAMDRAKGLTCRECGRAYPSSPVHVCEHCSGPLEVEYGYGALRGRVSRAAIEWGPPRVWRHVPPLPLDL
jgi:threonine synthase